jgi:acylphosphatase
VTHEDEPARLTAWVRGRVQGVGFRWWVRARALELGLVGSATNLDDGRVQVEAEGPRTACERLLTLLSPAEPAGPAWPGAQGRPGVVTGVVERWSAPRGVGLTVGFVER